MKALVGLEAVSAIPITTSLDEGLGTLDMLLDKRLVAVEKRNSDNGENEIDLGAKDTGLFE